jgi:hypothetical protein
MEIDYQAKISYFLTNNHSATNAEEASETDY